MRMQLFNQPANLQLKLTFYSLFWFTVGLLATFIVTVILIKLYLDTYLTNQTIVYSQQTARDIINTIDRDKETISAFLLSDTMRDSDNQTRRSIAIERLLSQNKNFLEGYLINLKGQTLVSVSLLRTFSANKPDFAGEKIYQDAKSGRIGISGWENFTDKNQPYWYMALPIEKYPGKIIGVLIVTIDLRRIEDAVLTSPGAKYGYLVLVDRDGKVLVHPDRSKLGNNWSKLKIVQRVIHGEIGHAYYYNEKGQYVLAAYQPLEPYPWGLIVHVAPEQTIDVFHNKVILLYSLMIIVIIVITGPLTYIAAGRIVVPIKELTRTSQKFGQRETIQYSPVDGNDEIAQLSAAFYEMAASIQDHEKQRAQYISMIAHDIRNPLRLITKYLQMTSVDTPNSDQKLKHPGFTMLEQVNRMISDLLEFSRLDLGEISFNFEMVSVKYLCEEVISGYREHSHKFIIQPFSEQICVWADPIRLQQILQNIFDNSLKYTPSESTITIHCRTQAAMVEILISDTGPGIPPEVLPDLFKPFHPNSYQKEGSYSLGLAIAKKLAIRMNGDLKAESVKNQGSSFRIILEKSRET